MRAGRAVPLSPDDALRHRRPLPGRFLTMAREGLRPGATRSLLSWPAIQCDASPARRWGCRCGPVTALPLVLPLRIPHCRVLELHVVKRTRRGHRDGHVRDVSASRRTRRPLAGPSDAPYLNTGGRPPAGMPPWSTGLPSPSRYTSSSTSTRARRSSVLYCLR